MLWWINGWTDLQKSGVVSPSKRTSNTRNTDCLIFCQFASVLHGWYHTSSVSPLFKIFYVYLWMFYAVIQVDYMFFKQVWNGDTRNFKRYTSGQRHYMHHLLWVLVTARLVLPLIVGLDRVYEGCFPIGYGSGNIGDWFIHLHGTVMHIPRGTSGVPVPPIAGTYRTRWQVSVYNTAFRSYIWTLNLVLFDIWSCRFLFTPPHFTGVLFRKW